MVVCLLPKQETRVRFSYPALVFPSSFQEYNVARPPGLARLYLDLPDVYQRLSAFSAFRQISDGLLKRRRKSLEILDECMKYETLGEILETHRWIGVEKYVDDRTLSLEERYQRLETHHMAETGFLIAKVRELAARVYALEME